MAGTTNSKNSKLLTDCPGPNEALSFFLPSVDVFNRIILELKNSTAQGYDGIPSRVVKQSSDLFALLIQHLFGNCLKEGVFPDSLKTAFVTPLHKGGDMILDNLRPISVSSFFSKILEKAINSKIADYLERTKLLNERQFGFRRQRSTEDAMLEVRQFLGKSTDKKIYVL